MKKGPKCEGAYMFQFSKFACKQKVNLE